MHARGEVSFRRVATFNIDEFCGLGREHPMSQAAYMWEHFDDSVAEIEERSDRGGGHASTAEELAAEDDLQQLRSAVAALEVRVGAHTASLSDASLRSAGWQQDSVTQ
jgi:6-phosphogluconolactonase/glucosamine-6-phosphate isomerase/deaminase